MGLVIKMACIMSILFEGYEANEDFLRIMEEIKIDKIFKPTLIFLNESQLFSTKIKAISNSLTTEEKKIIDQQKRWCKLPKILPSVVNKMSNLPPSNDVHDYYSLAIYYWPNMTLPYPHTPYIKKDGYVNPEIDSISDIKEFNNMVKLALICNNAFILTANETYAEHTAILIRTWFINPETRMNPNMNYAQIKKGHPYKPTENSGIIDFWPLWRLHDVLVCLRKSSIWTPADDKAIVSWFEEFLKYYLESPQGRYEAAFVNNRRIYYNLNVIVMAHFLGKLDIAYQYIQDTFNAIDWQIKSDGTMPHEAGRASSFSYYTFNINAYMVIGTVSKNMNYPLDLFKYKAPNGGSLRKTIDLLIKYSITNEILMPGSNVKEIDGNRLLKALLISGEKIDIKYFKFAENLTDFANDIAYYNVTGVHNI